MLKRFIALFLTMAMIVSMIPPVAASETGTTPSGSDPGASDTIQDTTTAVVELEEEEPMEPDVEPEPFAPENKVLLIQQRIPYTNIDYNVNLLNTLKSSGYIAGYKKVTISDAVNTDLSKYAMVMVAGGMYWTDYEEMSNSLMDKLCQYLTVGGSVYFSMSTKAGAAAGSLTNGLPGGVKLVYDGSEDFEIVDREHPIVTGELTDGAALTDGMLTISGNNGQFFKESTLPAETNVIIRSDSPVLVEYPYGRGHVVASTLPWEYYYNNGRIESYNKGHFAPTSYDDLIVYTLSKSSPTMDTRPVTNLRATNVGSRTVELAWNPAPNSDVVGYRIYRDGTLVGDVGERTFTDRTSMSNATYTYQVVGYTAGGLETEAASLDVKTKADPRISQVYAQGNFKQYSGACTLRALVNNDSDLDHMNVKFYYAPGSVKDFMPMLTGSIKQIEVEPDYSYGGNSGVFGIVWNLDGIEPGTYIIGCKAEDQDGQWHGNYTTIKVTTGPPEQVKDVEAAMDPDGVHVSWNVAAPINIQGYNIYRRVQGETEWTKIGEQGVQIDGYLDDTAQLNVPYEYMVTAVGATGLESEYSQIASCIIAVDTTPVGDLYAPPAYCSIVRLGWNPPTNPDVTSYKIYRSGELVDQVADCWFEDIVPIPGREYEYQVVGCTDTGLELEPAIILVQTTPEAVIEEVYTNQVGDEGYLVTPNNSTLYIRINADASIMGGFNIEFPNYSLSYEALPFISEGYSTIYFVDWDLTDVESGLYEIPVEYMDYEGHTTSTTIRVYVDNYVPAKVMSLKAAAEAAHVELTWVPAFDSRVEGYRIYRRILGESQWELIGDEPGRSSTSFSDYNAEPGVTYEYTITAVSESGAESEYCESVFCTIAETLDPVSNLRVDTMGPRYFHLEWDAVPNRNVIGYRVLRDGVQVDDIPAEDYRELYWYLEAGHDQLAHSTVYEYQVVGYTASGLETEPAVISICTFGQLKILDVYTKNGNEIRPDDTTVYVRVNKFWDDEWHNVNDLKSWISCTGVTVEGGSKYQYPAINSYTIDSDGIILELNLDIVAFGNGVHDLWFMVADPDTFSEVSFRAQININCGQPAAITGLGGLVDTDVVMLYWNMAPEYDVFSYRVYRRVQGDTEWIKVDEIPDRNLYFFSETIPEKGVIYEYAVTAVSVYNVESEFCEPFVCTVLADTEKPVITSLIPARYTVLSGDVTVTAEAKDNDVVEKLELYYRTSDGMTVLFATEYSPVIVAQLDTRGIPDGFIEVYAIATDASGNESDGIPVYLYQVDNTGPNAVTALTYTSTATVITLSWSYDQDDDFSHFVVEELGEDGIFRQKATVNKTLGVNLMGLRPGSSHTYRVYAVDQVGNVSGYSDELTAVTQADTTAPVVTAISPSAGYRNADFTVTFTMKDDDCVAGAKIQVSRDRLTWQTVAERTFAGVAQTRNAGYTVDVSEYPEDGSLYLRAIPMDASGNAGDSTQTAPFVEYILDRTAPGVPRNVTAKASGTSICVMWDNDAAGETAGYRVLRGESEDGPYTQIASGLKAISYYDRTAKADTTYWYRVQAQDTVGNVSGGSVPVSAAWTNSTDTQAPEILSIGPANGSTLGGGFTNISVLAQDDCMLSRIEITCAKVGLFDGVKQTLTVSGNGSYYLSAAVTPDLSQYDTGDRMKVTVAAYDGNDNSSGKAEYTYIIDRTAPAVADLTARLSGASVTITWSAGADSEDLNGYYIYRSKGSGWVKLGTRGAREDGRYTFTDNLTESGEYIYKVVAIDRIDNKAEFVSQSVSYTKPEPALLIADFTTDRQQQERVEYLFDATASYSSVGPIVSYHYDFGDGTTADKAQAIHAYQNMGVYTVLLTVTDANGCTDTASMTVEVRERETVGHLTVNVVDDSGIPVSGAPVYFNMETDDQIIKYTNANGSVIFTGEPGTYIVGAYMDGYLPVTKQAVLAGSTTRSVELIMVHQPIVTGEFEVHRMTLEEIKAAGIDVNDPANQNCVSVTVQMSYGEQMVGFDFVRNEQGQVVFGENTTVIGDRQFTAMVMPDPDAWNDVPNGSGDSIPGGGTESPIPRFDVVAILETPVSASFLKEFFDVKLHIINQAAAEFSLVNNLIELNVPSGMTLMSESQSSASETLDELKGQQDWTLSWILRGDAEGKYQLTADYSAILSSFDADVSARFKSPDIQVYGSSAIHLVLNLNKSLRYQACYLDVGIKNMTGMDLHLPSVGISNVLATACTELASSGELQDAIQFDADSIRTWIENTAGLKQDLMETPQALAGGETLYHRYAIYGVTQATTVQYLNNIILKELNNLGLDQIEVYVNDLDLYPDDGRNAEQIMQAGHTTARDALDYLLDPYNFLYYQVGYDDESSIFHRLTATYKDALDVFLSFEFDCFTKNKEEKFFRAVVAEMMSDEVVADYVSAQLDSTYAEITKDVLGTLAASLKLMDAGEKDEVDSAFARVMQDDAAISGLASIMQNEGMNTNFQTRLAQIVAVELANYDYESILELLSKPEYREVVDLGLAEKLGQVGTVFKFGADLANGWADAIEAANYMMTLRYAQEEATYLLQTMVDVMKDGVLDSHWMCKEAQKMLDELNAAAEEEWNASVRAFESTVGEAIAENGVEHISDQVVKAVDQYLLDHYGIKATNVGGTIKILKAIYAITDYALNLSDYYERHDQLVAMMTMNAVLMTAYAEADTAAEQVRALKYIIKNHLVGERIYADYINASERRQENFLEGYGDTVNAYLQRVTADILKARDKLYNTVTTQSGAPAAPEALSFNYMNGCTDQSFDASFEYSLDGGESWTVCGGPISVAAKTIGQTLRVRVKATSSNRAGNSAVLHLNAAPRQSFASAAGALKDTCVIWGLMPTTYYEVLRVESLTPENPDWAGAENVCTDENGTLKTSLPGDGGYLLYRLGASSDAFASVANGIALERELLVEISASAEGDGSVLMDGAAFTSAVLENGAELTLTACCDAATTQFLGWYVDGQLYAEKAELHLEAVESLSLTAKFKPLSQFTLEVIAGDGGTVTGGGVYFKGSKAVARAFASTGYTFDYWTDANGDPVGINSTRTLTMMEDVTLKAVFKKLPTAQVFVSLAVQRLDGMALPTVQVEVDGKIYVVTADAPMAETSGVIQQGETITLTAHSTADASFDSWRTETGIVVSRNAVYTTTAAEYTSYVAHYKVAGHTVSFKNASGNILSSVQYPASVTADQILVANAPAMNGYTFAGWTPEGSKSLYTVADSEGEAQLRAYIVSEVAAGRDVSLKAQYEKLPDKYTVKIINGSGSGTYTASTALTVTAKTAPEGQYFVGWYENDVLLSTSARYSFYVTADRTIEARFDKKVQEILGVTNIQSVTCDTANKKISFVSMSSVPTGCTILKAGVVATSDASIGESGKLDASNAAYVRYGTPTAPNFKYTWTKSKVTADQAWYVRAYLVYADENGNTYTVFSETIKATLNGVVD